MKVKSADERVMLVTFRRSDRCVRDWTGCGWEEKGRESRSDGSNKTKQKKKKRDIKGYKFEPDKGRKKRGRTAISHRVASEAVREREGGGFTGHAAYPRIALLISTAARPRPPERQMNGPRESTRISLPIHPRHRHHSETTDGL